MMCGDDDDDDFRRETKNAISEMVNLGEACAGVFLHYFCKFEIISK